MNFPEGSAPFVYKGKEIGFGYTCINCGRIKGRGQFCDHGKSEPKDQPIDFEKQCKPDHENINEFYNSIGEKNG